MISKQTEVQMLRHPLLLMCGRIQSREEPTAAHNWYVHCPTIALPQKLSIGFVDCSDGHDGLLDSTGILPLAHHLVADLGEASVSVRGVLCSSIVNVVLQFVQEEVKASTVADSVDGENDSKEERFEATDCLDDVMHYEAYSSISNCCAKLRDLSKRFALQ